MKALERTAKELLDELNETDETDRLEAKSIRFDTARSLLESKNIQTRNLFAGNITKNPCCEALIEGVDYRIAVPLDNTDTIMNSSLWIGLYPGMGDARLDYMIGTIREFCA